jgi:hypothetical protein
LQCITHSFLSENDTSQELVFQPLHGDGEIDDGGAGGDLGGVGRVGQLGGNVEGETLENVTLLVPHFDFEGGADLDEVLFQHVIQGGVKFLPDVL